MKRLFTVYNEDITKLRLSGNTFIESRLRTGIPPRVCKPTQYLGPHDVVGEVPYWRSVATRRDMMERIQKYINYEGKQCKDFFAVKARRFVSDAILGKLRSKVVPLSYCAAFKKVPQDTSPGFPWTRLGIYEKRNAKPVFQRLREIERRLYDKKFEYAPCVAQARLQICTRGENKPRLVWAYPMELTMMEATFALPLIKVLRNLPYFAWNYNWLDGYGQVHYDKMSQGRGIKTGFDWKSYDAEIPSEDIRWAFDLLSKLVEFRGREKMRWTRMVEYFVNTPILAYGNLYLIKGGIPSGSFFTQVVGTVLNMYYSSYIFLRLAYLRTCVDYVKFDDLFPFAVFLGDDTSINADFCGHFDDREVLVEIARTHLKKTIHPTKGFFYPRADYALAYEFLGKKIESRSSVHVDPWLVLAQVLYPEKPDLSPGDTLTRIIGVLWMCGTDPVCDSLCRMLWTMVKDKYPQSQPTPYKKDIADAFKFVLFQKLPALELPSRDVLLARYICR